MVKEIPLQNGLVALVDDEDYERVSQYNWSVSYDKATSPRVQKNDKKNKTSNLKYFILEDIPPGKCIICKNHNHFDFTKENLKIVNKQDIKSTSMGHKGSSSKYKGVCWDKQYSKWRAMIAVNGKRKCLGRYENEDEAAKAYNNMAKKLIQLLD